MDKYFSAISLDDGFANMLDSYKSSKHMSVGRIHSLFRRVVNFEGGDGQIYTILDKSLDNGPYAVRVDFEENDNLFDLEIKLNDEVVLENKKLRLGAGISIKFDRCRTWQPQNIKKKPEEIDNKQIRDNIDIYRRRLIDAQIRGGCSYYHIKDIAGGELYKAVLMERELDGRIRNFLTCLKSGSDELEKEINSLIGLGNGLTPSGDDFLAGFITAVGVIEGENAKAAFKRIKEAIRQSVMSTTDISRSMINASLEGKRRERMSSFIDAMLHSDRQMLNISIDKVLAIGSTSGADLSSGVVAGLVYGLNILENGGL